MKLLPFLALLAACGTSDPDDETGPPPVCEHAPAPARSLRVFAVGHKLEVSEAATYATYTAAFRATVDRDVVPHLATDRVNVLVFPESVAFTAAFVGSRGADARTKDSAFAAYIALQGAMQDAFAHYRTLAPFAQLGTWILLAASDPTWRAFDQTFSGIARDYHVYVIASVDIGDVAPAPSLADTLGDPERPPGSPVVEVPDGEVYNQAIVYGPDGTLLGKLRKEFLTDPELGQLGITGALPERVAMELPVAKIASMISRDAWMPGLQDRIAAAGTELMLQPEAFDTWTTPAAGAPWPADNLKRSSWAAVQKHPELRMAVAPMLAGNFFDVPFDGQTFIAMPGAPSQTPAALLAQEPDTGWAAIAPWVVPDPDGSLDEQRTSLRTVGQGLLPGGAHAGAQVEGTVWADLDVPADDGYAVTSPSPDGESLALGPSSAVAPSGIGRQRSAAPVVLSDGTVVIAWEDTRFCTGQIVVARGDASLAFSPPVHVSPWNHPQHDPSLVALPDDTLVLAWQEVLGDGKAEVRVATSKDRGATWTRRVRVDQAHTIDAWQPALATDGTTVYLVFVDSRGDDPNRRVYLAHSDDAGATWSAPLRVDPRDRDEAEPDHTMTDEWAARIVAHDRHVVIAYTHRERPDAAEQPSWDATVIESLDGGMTFGDPQRLDTGGSPERIASDTSLALDAAGAYRAAFSTYRGAQVDADLLLASPATTSFRTDAKDQWWPSVTASAVAWQDFRHGGNDIYVAKGGDPALRVDDGGASDIQSWRPRAATAPDGSLYVVWEDSRSGHAELRVAHGTLP